MKGQSKCLKIFLYFLIFLVAIEFAIIDTAFHHNTQYCDLSGEDENIL